MLHQLKGRSQTTTYSTHAPERGRAGMMSSLRGMSYADGAALLSPKKRKTEPRQLPPEIEALGLKRVKVIIEDGAWDKLSPSEQQGVLTYLSGREAFAKKAKRTRGYTVTIGSQQLGPQTDDQLAGITDQATVGAERLDKGRAPKHRDDNPNAYIDVNPGKVKIDTQELAPEDKPAAANFDAESTFPSARYQPEDMNNAAFDKTLEEAAAYLAELRAKFGPDVQLSLTVESGESLVTPPSGMVTGDLARLRAETAIARATAYFEAAGIDLTHIDFGTQTHIGTAPYVRGVSDPDAQCYTDEQFLRVTVEMSGEPQPDVIETHTTDAEVVTLHSKADLKHKDPPKKRPHRSGRSKGPSERQKRLWHKHAADC